VGLLKGNRDGRGEKKRAGRVNEAKERKQGPFNGTAPIVKNVGKRKKSRKVSTRAKAEKRGDIFKLARVKIA